MCKAVDLTLSFFRASNNARGENKAFSILRRETQHFKDVFMLRCFNPYVYDGYHASPLITVLSDFPHPDLDAFPDDASIKPIVLASSDLVKLEDWWWPYRLIFVVSPAGIAFSSAGPALG